MLIVHRFLLLVLIHGTDTFSIPFPLIFSPLDAHQESGRVGFHRPHGLTYMNTYPEPGGFTVDSYSVLDPMDSSASTLQESRHRRTTYCPFHYAILKPIFIRSLAGRNDSGRLEIGV